MSFSLYLIGFVIVIAGLAWGAMVAGVPQTYILIGAVVLFGIGILSAVKRTRPKDPPAPTAAGRRTDDY
ncbi:hypothetical protein GCM10028796_45180 [Ramlibacter monticola]|uniref:Uncharacterized protein n=1 Tax=Ramlibacter monticola TaxID=1926872 RepID=A0A936Z3S6_9BURK|nr:hypothetical protein [Ramlibacter monticola]MBL0393115.1 hypothetical protein [Ramlibacter monticola]